jgi:hypothetical protein
MKLRTDWEWASSGLNLRKGERVRIRAWGRARIGAADGALSDPNGLEKARLARLTSSAPPAMLIGVIGESGNDYIKIGKEAEFVADRDGVLYLCLNQLEPAGNDGEFDVRVSVGHATSLSFDVPSAAPTPNATATSADGSKVVAVSPTLDWTNSYIVLERGDRVEIEATGRVNLELGGRSAGPEGIAAPDSGKLLADRPTGALIAVIGTDNNDFIFVGKHTTITAERSGLLFLGVNEEDLTNNTGGFSAKVKVVKGAKP